MCKATIDAVIARIRAYARFRGWGKSKLAREAKLYDTTLRHFDGDQWNPSCRILRQIEAIIPADFNVDDAAEPLDPAGDALQKCCP